MITGGYDGSSRLSSTEMFTEGQLGWTDVGPLPFAATLLRGVSLNNRIIMTGDNFFLQLLSQNVLPLPGGYTDKNTLSSILSFDVNSLDWTQVGSMLMKRGGHGVSVVNSEDVLQYCVDK